MLSLHLFCCSLRYVSNNLKWATTCILLLCSTLLRKGMKINLAALKYGAPRGSFGEGGGGGKCTSGHARGWLRSVCAFPPSYLTRKCVRLQYYSQSETWTTILLGLGGEGLGLKEEHHCIGLVVIGTSFPGSSSLHRIQLQGPLVRRQISSSEDGCSTPEQSDLFTGLQSDGHWWIKSSDGWTNSSLLNLLSKPACNV